MTIIVAHFDCETNIAIRNPISAHTGNRPYTRPIAGHWMGTPSTYLGLELIYLGVVRLVHLPFGANLMPSAQSLLSWTSK